MVMARASPARASRTGRSSASLGARAAARDRDVDVRATERGPGGPAGLAVTHRAAARVAAAGLRVPGRGRLALLVDAGEVRRALGRPGQEQAPLVPAQIDR